MSVRRATLVGVCTVMLGLDACSRSSSEKPQGTIHLEVSDKKPAFALLVNKIWRRSGAPYGQASGSIYIFLSNGTLLETSCVETYRIATWSVDSAKPDTLRVVEDQREAFTATLGEAEGNTLHLKQTLLHQSEAQDVTLTAVEGEFVCPDLKK
jgi:hypothetical protein